MTGPLYPPGPQPGSNGIGMFEIGVSPVGTIAPFDVWSTVISQYANSPILTQLIENISEYLDQTANLDAFFDVIFNVDTAQGYGLDVWGRIVGVNRVLEVQVGDFLGIEEALPGSEPFNQASFFSGTGLTSNYALSDTAYRQLIFAKAAANISDGSIPAINQILLGLFPNRGNCYAADGLNMTMQYVFNFALSAVELAIVGQSGVLPKPVGVAATVVVND